MAEKTQEEKEIEALEKSWEGEWNHEDYGISKEDADALDGASLAVDVLHFMARQGTSPKYRGFAFFMRIPVC